MLRHWYATEAVAKGSWVFHAGIPGEPAVWKATFSPGTPVPLVGAFTSSLVEDLPLTRSVRDIPVATRDYLHFPEGRPIKATSPKPQPKPAAPPPTPPAGRPR
ncbi:DUF317 domain-containing protein [Streptomyces sp. NPDC055078]